MDSVSIGVAANTCNRGQNNFVGSCPNSIIRYSAVCIIFGVKEETMKDISKRQREFSDSDLQQELKRRQIQAKAKTHHDEALVSCAPSLSIFSALKRLDKIFLEVIDSISTAVFPTQHVLFLLRTHPSMISVAFHKRTVISFFLQADVSLSVLKEVCEMMKSCASKSPDLCFSRDYDFHRVPNAISDACLYSPCRHDAIRLLLKEFPHEALGTDVKGHIPLDLLLQRALSSSFIPLALFLRSYDEARTVPSLPNGLTLEVLESLAAFLSFYPAMLKYSSFAGADHIFQLLDRCKVEATALPLCEELGKRIDVDSLVLYSSTVSSAASLFLNSTLPKLKSLYLPYDDRDDNTLHGPNCVPLLSLQPMVLPNMEDFTLELTSCSSGTVARTRWEEKTKFLATRAIQNFPRLKTLTLIIDGESKDDSSHMSFFTDAVTSNAGIESVELQQMRLTRADALMDFFSQVPTIKKLVLAHVSIVGNWGNCQVPASSCLEAVKIQDSVEFTDCNSWSRALLVQLVKQVPSLKEIELVRIIFDREEVNDITELLLAVFKANSVRSFNLSFFEDAVAQEAVCGSPTTITSLEKLMSEALENNTRLQSLRCEQLEKKMEDPNMDMKSLHHWQKMQYYVALNSYGRAEAKQDNFTLAGLLSILCMVAEAPSGKNELLQHNIQRGFLHLNPSLWAGTC